MPTYRFLALAALCGSLLLTGCDPLTSEAAPPPSLSRAEALQQLDTLSVGSWHSMSGYSRERFPHWASQGDGCDTRDLVLKRDGTGVVASKDCKITSGTWVSAYDGRKVTAATDVDVDHMVPLANAWRTGAADWTEDQREQFANDLTRPQLLAVTASSNRSKGDQDPSQWRPPVRGYWCTYAQRWITVKVYWKLIVTKDEKSALQTMLETC